MKPQNSQPPPETQYEVREARAEDREQLSNLLLFESHVHKHLDWKGPLDWLGHSPFIVLQEGPRLTGALACPQDPPAIAWLRLFVFGSHLDGGAAWQLLWPAALHQLRSQGGAIAAVIAIHRWLDPILLASGFKVVNHIVLMELDTTGVVPVPPAVDVSVRSMLVEDLPRVLEVDTAAFEPLWRSSLEALRHAFGQASYASIAEHNSGMLGYQLSTGGAFGTHLARLAVHPAAQGRGLGASLVHDLLAHIPGGREPRLTVNTQSNNSASHALYARLGFRRTGGRFPVFALDARGVHEMQHDEGGPG